MTCSRESACGPLVIPQGGFGSKAVAIGGNSVVAASNPRPVRPGAAPDPRDKPVLVVYSAAQLADAIAAKGEIRKFQDALRAAGKPRAQPPSPLEAKIAAKLEEAQPLRVPSKEFKDGVASVAFSPDGKRLASGGADGAIILWDTQTWAETGRLEGHGKTVGGLAFSPDGKFLVSGGADRTVLLWDLAAKAIIHQYQHPRPVFRVAFLPDSKHFVAMGPFVVSTHHVASDEALPGQLTTDDQFRMIAVSAKGEVAVADAPAVVTIWDPLRGKTIAKKERQRYAAVEPDSPPLAAENTVTGLLFRANGDLLMADMHGTWEWRPGTGEVVHFPLSGQAHQQFFLTGREDLVAYRNWGKYGVRAAQGGWSMALWEGWPDGANDMASSPNGDLIAAAWGGSWLNDGEWAPSPTPVVKVHPVTEVAKMKELGTELTRLRNKQEALRRTSIKSPAEAEAEKTRVPWR